MIIPENNNPVNSDDAEDQKSQQDVQSDGIDDIPASDEDEDAADLDKLTQADKAAESSFTLNVDKGIAPGDPDRE